MTPRRRLLPPELIESIGSAAIARSELELAIDALVAVLAKESTRYGVCQPRDAFRTKLNYLVVVPHSRLLKHDWCRAVRKMAEQASATDQLYRGAALGGVYSRMAEGLEMRVREIARLMNVTPDRSTMTFQQIDRLAQDFRALTMVALDLAEQLLSAATKLSILPPELAQE